MTALLEPDEIPPGAIIFWVIYDRPVDHPNAVVLRPQFSVYNVECPEHYGTVTNRIGRAVVIASPRVWICQTVDEARALVPPGCHLMADNNPKIAEVWMQ